MMNWIRKVLGITALEERIITLLALNKNLERQLEIQPQFVTLRVPEGEAIQQYLASLHASDMFRFYLLTLENDMMALFREGKGEEIYRGGLNALHKIRQDIYSAHKATAGNNG